MYRYTAMPFAILLVAALASPAAAWFLPGNLDLQKRSAAAQYALSDVDLSPLSNVPDGCMLRAQWRCDLPLNDQRNATERPTPGRFCF